MHVAACTRTAGGREEKGGGGREQNTEVEVAHNYLAQVGDVRIG